MASSSADILFRYLADTKSLEKGNRRARGDFKKTERSTSKLTGAVTGVQKAFIAAGGAMAIREVGQFVADTARMAEKAGIVSDSFEKIFQESAPKLRDSLEQTRLQVGLNSLEFESLLLKTGLLLDGFGSTAEEAGKFAEQMFIASADMAAFTGDAAATDDALHALNRALVGEFDPLEQFVGGIKASTVAQEALQLGLADTVGELTDQNKATALLSLVSKNASSSVGALATQEGTLAANAAEADARLEDVQIRLGRKLIGPMTKATGAALNLAVGLEFLSDETVSTVDKLDAYAVALDETARKIDPIRQLTEAVTRGFFDWKNGVEEATTPVERMGISVARLDGFMEELDRTTEDTTAEILEYTEAQLSAAASLRSFEDGMVGVLNRGGSLIQFFRDMNNEAANARAIAILLGGGGLGGGRDAQGGTIQPGDTHLVGEKGPELITPRGGAHITPSHRSGGGGGGVTINVEFSGIVGDPTAVAEQLQDLLEQYTRTNVAF